MPLTLVPPRKGKSPNHRIRGTVRGISIDETTGTADKSLADAYRIKREGQILNESVFGARASRTFAEAAVMYVETVNPTGTQRDAIIGRERKDGTITPHLIADFGDRLVNTIDQTAVQEVIRRRCGHLKPNTIEREVLTPLTAVLNFAARQKWCDRPMLDRPKYNDQRERWTTYAEADRLLAAAAAHIRVLLLFLMLSGARMGEALALDWAEIDLAQGWAVIDKTKRFGEPRGIPLHPQVVAALANLPRRTGRVFLTNLGLPYAEKKVRGGGQIKTAWKATCRRAGIKDLRPHDLRHTFSTWLTMAGVINRIRDELMGHAATEIGSRYAHVPRAEATEAVNRLPIRGISVDLSVQKTAKIKSIQRVV
jgi:integrase